MPWFYNSHSGAAHFESGVAAIPYEAVLHAGIGWHEYATQAQMNAAVKANGWPAPTGSISTGLSNLGQSAVSGVGSSLLGNLNPENILLRTGEVALGVVLVAIGLNALLKNPVGKAASVAAVVK